MFRYSAIDTAHRCLQRYERQWINGEPQGPEGIDLHFGTAIHCGVQASLEGDDSEGAFVALWDSIKGQELIPGNYSWDVLREMGLMFLTRFQRLHVKHFEPFKIEETISGKIGDYEFQGTPDYLGKYKGVPSILDFKTSNYRYMREKILSNEQMPIYDQLARQAWGYEALQMVYFVFVKSTMSIQIMSTPLTKQLLDNAIRNVILTCDDLKNRTVYPKNPSSCLMGKFVCPYFSKCFPEVNDE